MIESNMGTYHDNASNDPPFHPAKYPWALSQHWCDAMCMPNQGEWIACKYVCLWSNQPTGPHSLTGDDAAGTCTTDRWPLMGQSHLDDSHGCGQLAEEVPVWSGVCNAQRIHKPAGIHYYMFLLSSNNTEQ